MSSRIVGALSSKLALWIALALGGAYFIFGFDREAFMKSSEPFHQRVLKSIHMPNLKLGIDLQGGSYLVYGVEVEKALEKRLFIENKGIEKTLKRDSKSLPVKRDIKDLSLHLVFESSEKSRVAFSHLQDRNKELNFALSGDTVVVTLGKALENRIRTTAVEQAVVVLRTRLDSFDVKGLLVSQHGERKVVVQLPGRDDVDEVKASVMKAALLEFKIVDKFKPTKDMLIDELDGEVPGDKVIVMGEGDGEDSGAYLVSTYADLTGEHIVDAHLSYDEYGKPAIGFKFDAEGTREFKEITANNRGKQLGIIMDDIMICAPQISVVIDKGQGIIHGSFTAEGASRMASLLKSGALLAPLNLETENRVGASLGNDSIRNGFMACIVALALLFVFSIFYYGILGFFAILALIYNLFLILLALSYLKATLTLPGIAAMVLTIGMAIDASILIYEKMKEELRAGASFKKAIDVGFSGSMRVIIDANLTSFLTGIVLYYFGGPAIKGFAVSIMIGIVATVLSGVYFLKSIFDFVFEYTNIKRFKA